MTLPPPPGSGQRKGQGIIIQGRPPLAPTGRPPLAPINVQPSVLNGRTVMLKDAPPSQVGGRPVKSAPPPAPKSAKGSKGGKRK